MKVAVLFAIPFATSLLAEPVAPSMQAIVVRQFGGPEVLKLEDAPKPEPKQDEILVKVIAAGVNSFDGTLRSGNFAKDKIGLPWIPGYDIAGTVEKAGDKVTGFKAGDPVYAMISILPGGGYAEYAIVKEAQAAPKPATISFTEAAGVPSVALTAWQALVDKANIRSSQTVLIHGASGGVGMFAIPIAKTRGAKVFATASTTNQDFLKELGADVPIDYKTQKFEEIVKDVDVVVDCVGGETMTRSYPIVKKDGILVSLVDRPDQAQLDKYGIRGTSLIVKPNGEQLVQIGKLIDQKKIKIVISDTYPLTDAAKAETKADTGHAHGKIVLKIRDEPK